MKLILCDELSPENNSQDARSDQSNLGGEASGGKRFLKRHERKEKFAAASSDVTAMQRKQQPKER
jgi:hypothetical protein